MKHLQDRILKTAIASVSELFSIAMAMERGLAAMYNGHTSRIGEFGNTESANMFKELATVANLHLDMLTELADLENLEVPEWGRPIEWSDPGIATTYDIQAIDPFRSTEYKVLAFAVHNEERSFRYFSYVAADSDKKDVRHHAKAFARTKLDQAESLRKRRRQAWHRQRERSGADPVIYSDIIRTRSDLLAVAICADGFLLRLMETAEAALPGLKTLVENTRRARSENEKALKNSQAPGPEVRMVLHDSNEWRKQAIEDNKTPINAMRRLFAEADRCFAFYDMVVRTTGDEEVLLMAQELSSQAIDRIDALGRLAESGQR